MNGLKVVARKEGFLDQYISLRVYSKHGGRYSIGEPIVMSEMSEHEVTGAVIDPVLRMSPTDAQQLMDSLWDCGLRPRDFKASSELIQAKDGHIKDLRYVVERTLK